MRDIIFRGKRTDNGEWVYYGTPTKDSRGETVMVESVFECDEYNCRGANCLYVDENTVGQYTGLTDKNGKKIFEGDIVRTQPFSDKPYSSKAKYKQHIGVVEYRVQHFKSSLYEQDYEGKWIVKISDYGKFTCCNWNEFFKCEVVGNIYDNPELLRSDTE